MSSLYQVARYRQWEVLAYLQNKDVAPHSIYTTDRFELPYYTQTHRQGEGNRTIVHLPSYEFSFVYKKLGLPIPNFTSIQSQSWHGLMTGINS